MEGTLPSFLNAYLIHNRKMNEWDNLAVWVVDNKLSCSNARWMIQIPRLFSVYKANGMIQSFQQMIDSGLLLSPCYLTEFRYFSSSF
jgi:adenosine deaminase